MLEVRVSLSASHAKEPGYSEEILQQQAGDRLKQRVRSLAQPDWWTFPYKDCMCGVM